MNHDDEILISAEAPKVADEPLTAPPPPSPILLSVWSERRFIVKAGLVGLLVGVIIALVIRPYYESTARLMPPEKQVMTGLAAILASGAEDKAGALAGSALSEMLGLKSSGALFIGVLRSRTIEDRLVSQFDLRKVYGVRRIRDARKRLEDESDISEDRKSGIISITVADKSPQRARDLAMSYVDTLNTLMAELNTSAAHRERLFLEQRLNQAKQELDASSKELSDFSSRTSALDIKEQGKAIVGAMAELQGQLIATEAQLRGLEQIYTPNNVRVRSLQARAAELRDQIERLRGNEPDKRIVGDIGSDLSIGELPKLGLTYYDLYRRVKVQEAVFETLTKMYELARVQEAREVPSVKLLDVPVVPEAKAGPPRTLIAAGGLLLGMLFAVIYLIISVQVQQLPSEHPLRVFGEHVRLGLADDLQSIRAKMPASVQRMTRRFRIPLQHRLKG